MRHLAPRTIEVLKLIKKKPLTRNDLAKKVGFPISVLNSILSRLEKAGHVRRERDANLAYFQQAKFVITETGKQMIKMGSGCVKEKPLPHAGTYARAHQSEGFDVAGDPRNVMSRPAYKSGDGEQCYYVTNIRRAQ